MIALWWLTGQEGSPSYGAGPMSADASSPLRDEHHARIRSLKRWLRFMPRRAVLHRYPIIGRFAHVLRDRFHLWSFRKAHVRPAYYLGSVLSLLPVMGIQLPLALLLSLLSRSNFMILGGLMFITNPFTAVPIYYGTYQLGNAVISIVSSDARPASRSEPREFEKEAFPHVLADEMLEPVVDRTSPGWKERARGSIAALVVGGTLAGLGLGLLLDLGDMIVRRRIARRRQAGVSEQREGG